MVWVNQVFDLKWQVSRLANTHVDVPARPAEGKMGLQDREYMRQRPTRRPAKITNKIIVAGLLLGAAALAAPLLGNVARNMACTQGHSLVIFYTGCDLAHPVNR
jgi:hypothetical protein